MADLVSGNETMSERTKEDATLLEEHLMANRDRASEVNRLLAEIDRLTAELIAARRREHDRTRERDQLRSERDQLQSRVESDRQRIAELRTERDRFERAHHLLEQSMSHQVSLLFNRLPRAKKAIIDMGHFVLKRGSGKR
jgi:chromosome segregation ATPase